MKYALLVYEDESQHFAAEVMHLTRLLVELLPAERDAFAVAALVRYSEARRPARVDADGFMVPLWEQDPRLWDRERISEADALLLRASQLGPPTARLLQAQLQRVWCARPSLNAPPPWPDVLRLYDSLIRVRDDPFVRINRAVAFGSGVRCRSGAAGARGLEWRETRRVCTVSCGTRRFTGSPRPARGCTPGLWHCPVARSGAGRGAMDSAQLRGIGQRQTVRS